jgi:putative alpha-1,2-mannosidase
MHLPGGVTFTVEAQGNVPDAVFVRRASLDGKPLPGNLINHADMMRGGTLHCEMMSKLG